ncbi:MAG: DNA polymerase III subunit beta [Kosmotoga sp.]|uniref:DNA polymerase III subunit beta n=1 Tax=Kosmotoga sp. TaxID=1955248 RepID=UPI0025BA7BB1|nr:DNA polymerase III subunit beta [Kosmotoga sp.]MCD6160228.1 DNA polymerase III subunit beta [Kosmotoga sp.]
MRFSIERGEILSRLESVASAVAQKTVKPVLSGVLFKATTEGKIELLATDLETAIKAVTTPVHIDGEGAFVVEAKVILEVIRNLPSGEIIFELQDNNLIVRVEKSKFVLPTISPDQFPEIEPTRGGIEIETSVTVLELMIDRVIFCAAKDEFMRNLNGIYWELQGGYLRLVAADGFRLALAEEKIESDVEDRFLLTLKSMKDLQSSIKTALSDDLRIIYDGAKVGFYFDGIEMIARVVDAEFPDYRKVLPKAFKTRVVANTTVLSDAIRRASIAARLGSESVKIELKGESIKLIAKSPEHGESTEELDVKKEGDDILIAFNPRFLADSIKKIDTEEVELNFVDSNSPLQMNPVDVEGYLYIIMPIRLI